MAEVTSRGISFRNAQTVIILSSSEARHLETIFHDWIDDSYSRGVECGDPEVLRHTRQPSPRSESCSRLCP